MNECLNHLRDLVRKRRSVRCFKTDYVDDTLIKNAIEVARYTPSASNTQPWSIWVAQGAVRQEIQERVCEAFDALKGSPELLRKNSNVENYYPKEWVSPYRERRIQNGKELYGLLDIPKGDFERMRLQLRRNFEFFDAPVGVFVTTHQANGVGSRLDIAMWCYALSLALKAQGLDSCLQAAWLPYEQIILPLLGAPNDHSLVLGISVGYEDYSSPINTLSPLRVPQSENVVWKKEMDTTV